MSRTEKENRDKSTFVVNFYFLGTGVALVRGKQTYVITNKHIVEKVEDVTRIYADFPPPIGAHPVNWSRKSFSGDIAVLATELKIDGETQEQIGEAKPSTPVFVVGFDDEHIDNLSMQRGAIEMLGAWVEDKHMLIPSGIYFGPSVPAMIISGVTCRAGGSGSPVFSLDGKILGIVKGFTDDRKCLAIRIGAALELLEPEKY